MRLRDLLDESVVKVGLQSVDKEECFEELVDLLVSSGRLPGREPAITAVADREAMGTTGIGNGCAIPHAKHPSIKRLLVAVGTSKPGIEFDAVDDQLVHIVVLILANPNEPGPHVRALAEVVRLLQAPGFYKKVTTVSTSQELLDALDAAE